jgi:putative salt-induced outer membrane protein YdiY
MQRSSALLALLLVIATGVQAADAPATPPVKPVKPWTGSIGAGLAITSGNTDTQNYNLAAAVKYDPKTRFLFKADALYLRGESGGVKQADKATLDARGEYTLSERTFTFGELTYLRDPFKDITYFIAPLAGAGYRLIRTDVRNLTVDGAVGGEAEGNGRAGHSTGGAVKAGENFDWALTSSSKITQKLSGIWKTSNFSDALYHFDAGLTTTVAKRAELKLSYLYDYKSRPTSASVKKGDSALFAALLFKF